MPGLDQKTYEKAVQLLSNRLHTTGELHRKLKTRGFEDEGIRAVLKKLEDLDFLNDERFAEIFVDNLKRYKDWGYFGIKAKLSARQIPGDIAARALENFFTLEDELLVAKKFLKKRGKLSYEKLARALSGKGFRSEITSQVLKNSD